LIEFKGNKIAIGGGDAVGEKVFANQEIELHKGDTVYIFSDGYIDQFGGRWGKKYKTRRFKSDLLEMQSLNMHKQEKKIIENFKSWKGEQDQVDDVLVIGMRF